MPAYVCSIIEYPTHCRSTNIYKCVAVATKQQCQLNDKCNNIASSLLCPCNSTMKKTIPIIDIFRYCGYSRVSWQLEYISYIYRCCKNIESMLKLCFIYKQLNSLSWLPFYYHIHVSSCCLTIRKIAFSYETHVKF